jgi:hypothetical protein
MQGRSNTGRPHVTQRNASAMNARSRVRHQLMCSKKSPNTKSIGCIRVVHTNPDRNYIFGMVMLVVCIILLIGVLLDGRRTRIDDHRQSPQTGKL